MNSTRSICFFNSCSVWGGGEKWHYDMALALQRRGYKVMVVCHPESELQERLRNGNISFRTIRIGNLSFLNPCSLLKISRILREANVETMVLNSPTDLKAAGVTARFLGIPRIVYRRGSAIPVRNTILNRYLYGSILTDIITNSEKTKDTILQNLSGFVERDTIHVVYNGMDVSEYRNVDWRPIYTKTGHEIVLGNAGRLVEQKGQKYLIELASYLKNRNISSKILIAGSGKLEGSLKEYAHQLGVSEHIIFLGFVERMQDFMESIDIYVHTSLWEGFGYVLIEAMASEKPVVAFDISSNPEIIDNNRTGYLVKAFDVDEMGCRVQELISNPLQRRSFGARGRERVELNFSTEEMIRKFESLISLSST